MNEKHDLLKSKLNQAIKDQNSIIEFFQKELNFKQKKLREEFIDLRELIRNL